MSRITSDRSSCVVRLLPGLRVRIDASADGITALAFLPAGRDHPPLGNHAACRILAQAAAALRAWTEGDGDLTAVPVDLAGLPPFRCAALTALRRIGRGHTTTYAGLAALAGRPGAARAAGGAVAANPVPMFVPCHRVLAASGLGGFSADCPGLEALALKRRLLAHEGLAR